MMLKRIGFGLLAIIIYGICLELGERFEIPGVHSFVSTAEAVVGRPLDTDELCRCRAQVCATGVLLGPDDRSR